MSSFGLARLKTEGAAMHPDDVNCERPDAWYYRQLKAYYEHAGGIPAGDCVIRQHVLEQLLKDHPELKKKGD